MLVEFRFHGRGGQGAVTAANLLAAAAVREGKYAQAFPHFGAERRGAPVTAYARVSDRPIERHSQVRNPDYVVVLDPELPKLVNVTEGLKDGGAVILNAPGGVSLEAPRVYCVDATRIARELGLIVAGWPVVNTAMLGALARVTGVVSLDSVVEAIKAQWPGAVGEKNAEAARRAFREVREC